MTIWIGDLCYNPSMTEADVIAHWRKGAKDALRVAVLAYEDGKYALALFNAHLAIEKALKAAYMEKYRKEAPWTHDLVHLSKELDRPWTDEEERLLGHLTEYAVAARYDDPPWAEHEATQEKTSALLQRTTTLLSALLQ